MPNIKWFLFFYTCVHSTKETSAWLKVKVVSRNSAKFTVKDANVTKKSVTFTEKSAEFIERSVKSPEKVQKYLNFAAFNSTSVKYSRH